MKYFYLFFFIAISVKSYSQCWTKIAASESSFAIKNDGTLWAWGKNDYGQLGDGSTIAKNVPTQIGTDSDWAEIDTNGNMTLALKINGTIWMWGKNPFLTDNSSILVPIQIGSESDWVKIAAPAFAIKSNGTLWGWGYNSFGDLGLGNTEPQLVPTQIGLENDWIEISASGRARLAIKADHSVWGWYYNYSGALAIGPVNPGNPDEIIAIPTQTGNGTLDWNKAITNGCCFTKLIKQDGTLWAHGAGHFGTLGNGTETPVTNIPIQIGSDDDWNSVDTSYHTLAIKNDGTLWAWGNNAGGQLGDGTTVNKNIPTLTATGISWMSIAVGLNYTLALSNQGTLYSWGFNANGGLGDGTFTTRYTPTQIGSVCSLSRFVYQTPKSVTAYPNPTTDKVIVNYLMSEDSILKISISDMLGQVICTKIIQGKRGENKESLDLTQYGTGVYILSIDGQESYSNIKIVKSK